MKDLTYKDLKEYFGEDLKELFGESLENILETAIKNYVDDYETKWDEVNCVQSLDVLMIVAKRLLKSLKDDDKKIYEV
jgi:hypothetical protein